MTFAMPVPAAHRMADPVTRRRAAAMLGAVFGLALAMVSLLGRPTGPFSLEELRQVSGLPFAPPQIERRIAPATGDTIDIESQLQELENQLRGGSPAQPTPTQSR
jgi:hypothetical protein